MKSRLLTILLTCAGASLAHADYNPVDLTPGSYTYDIVVEAAVTQGLPDCINVTAGNGSGFGDNTYYEQGLYARDGEVGGNSGIPKHNTTFTSINDSTLQFLMPPDYTVKNELMVDSDHTSGTFTFATATTATSLSILNCGGGGALTVNYTVTHSDSTTETGSLSLLDWFAGGATVAWGANGRITKDGGYNNYNNSAVNDQAPYLYANNITVSSASPVVSITFDTPSGNHANFYAVSGKTSGGAWVTIPVTGFNVRGTVPAIIGAWPVTATMDQGTNMAYNDNLATFFENGFVRTASAGLPVSGSTFDSFSQPSHHYKMGNYSANNAILVDTNHQTANITPVSPQSYSSFALLTAGGNVGSTPMTNLCILQHADGVNETNIFLGYDWFYNNAPGAIALKANGRVNMNARSLNNVNNGYPYLFETYFTLKDTTSPVTNILVKYLWAGSSSSTTFIMAVSAATGAIPPVVTEGPLPSSQTLWPGQGATFTVGVTGTLPITGVWQIQNGDSSWTPLSDGTDANGSIISGSHTFTLTITNLAVADSTNYAFLPSNVTGTGLISPSAALIVSPQLITITPATATFNTHNDIPLTVNLSAGPPVALQWFYNDNTGGDNVIIPGATNAIYTIVNASTSINGYTYGVTASNVYGTNTATVPVWVSDSPAVLGSDLSPAIAETYAGATVTYAVNAQGNWPITYKWMLNGNVVSGVNSNTFTFAAPVGTNTIQVSFSNDLTPVGTVITSSQVTLLVDASPTNITFNTNGAGWQTNTVGAGAVPTITNNVLTVTDGGGSEGSSAFYKIAQYVGGAWTASFTYNSHAGGADGAAFILQNCFSNYFALGGSGGQMGYGGITNSLAFEINLYNGNGNTPGIAVTNNGVTGGGIYAPAGGVSTITTNPIAIKLDFANGVLALSMTDTVTLTNYSTNYAIGSLVPILGGNMAYIGFSGGDGGVTSTQTISDFQFHSVLPTVTLAVSPVTANQVVLSWPVAASGYVLQTTASLSAPSWNTVAVQDQTGGTNHVTVNVASGTGFYRLKQVSP